jgi:hypothetical protein
MAKRSILRVDGPCEGRGRAHRQISSREGQRPVRALWCWRGERKCTYVHYVTHFMSLLWIRTRTPRGAEGKGSVEGKWLERAAEGRAVGGW